MSKRHKQELLQRWTQIAYKYEMLNLVCNQVNANKNCKIQFQIHKTGKTNGMEIKYWWRYGTTRIIQLLLAPESDMITLESNLALPTKNWTTQCSGLN